MLAATNAPDGIATTAGFLFTFDGLAIQRCTIGSCGAPQVVFAPSSSETLMGAFVGPASIAYTMMRTGSIGEVHSAGLDGKNDVALVSLPNVMPNAVAASGPRTFWADDQTGDVHCVGCAGADKVWMTTSDSVKALFTDNSSVYALYAGGSGTIYSCPQGTACATSPPVVLGGLDASTTAAQVGTDGTYVYAARATDVARVEVATTTVTPILAGETVAALAVDAKTRDLFYATQAGEIGRVASDGTRTPLGACGLAYAMTFDATYVYAAIRTGVMGVRVISVHR